MSHIFKIQELYLSHRICGEMKREKKENTIDNRIFTIKKQQE